MSLYIIPSLTLLNMTCCFPPSLDRSIDIDMGSEEEEESYSSDQENSDSGENLPEGQVSQVTMACILECRQ